MTLILNPGVETRVNTHTADNQEAPEVITLADGGYVVAWSSVKQDDATNRGIYAQRYDVNGHRVGSEFHVNTTTIYDQADQTLTALADGGFLITWNSTQNGGDYDCYSQRYDAAGAKVGGETLINTVTGGLSDGPSTTALTDGDYVVTWTQYDAVGQQFDIFAKQYNADGVVVVSDFRVNTYTTDTQQGSSIAALADGGYVITWTSQDQDGSNYGVYGQRYDTNGVATGGEFRVNTITGDEQADTHVTALNDGGFAVVWRDRPHDGSSYGVYCQVYTAAGGPNGGQTLVNSTTAGNQLDPAITALAGGGFVVVWDSANVDGNGFAIVAQVFDTEGDKVGGELQVNSFTTGSQDTPSVAARADGGFVVTWESANQDGNGIGVYSKVFAAATNLNGAQYLYGTVDADILDGGAGGDHMAGGFGDDTYVVNSYGDVVVENPGEGDDTVQAYVTYTLGSDVEFLTLMGGAAISGYGNSDNNVLTGNGNSNVLFGDAGDDTIEGNSGNDEVYGGDGNDTLIGGTGNDRLSGNGGNDLVFGGDQNDTILSSAGHDHVYGDAGTDTYEASGLFVAAIVDLLHGKATQGAGNITTLDGIENVTGSGFDDYITGNSGNNVLDGGAGADKLTGGLGDDTYYIDNTGDRIVESSDATSGGTDEVFSSITFTLATYVENLTLTGSANIDGTGNASDNMLTGNDGNNVLDGKAGNDTLIGGLGDDTYVLDVVGDTIVELPGEGTDTVKAAFSYSLANDLENLVLTGTGDFTGIGNAVNNTITGNVGNNILDGGTGADTMSGGAGNDTYIVDNTGDIVNDFSNSGTDTILSSVTYTLVGRFVETLQLTGSANINATGNSSANTLIGNTGNNSLTGGAAADIFLFQLASHADIITDFKATENDTIDVSAYHAVAHTVTQSGTSVIIDFGGGNTVTVLKTTVADVNAHTVF